MMYRRAGGASVRSQHSITAWMSRPFVRPVLAAGSVALLTLFSVNALAMPETAANDGAATPAATGTRDDSRASSAALTCQSRAQCGSPLKAGLQLAFTGWACTSGFLARDASADVYVVTAGHCLESAGLDATWSHGGAEIGRGARAAFSDGTSADAGAIRAAEAGPRNQLFASGTTDIRQFVGVRGHTEQPVDTRVCRSGAGSGWSCGRITKIDADTVMGGRTFHHTWWTDFPSTAGDSGGPVIQDDGHLLGIVIATTLTQTIYLPVDYVVDVLDLQPCVDALCS